MLSRDQVLHVARLARLQLTDDEVERYGGELSKITDWIEIGTPDSARLHDDSRRGRQSRRPSLSSPHAVSNGSEAALRRAIRSLHGRRKRIGVRRSARCAAPSFPLVKGSTKRRTDVSCASMTAYSSSSIAYPSVTRGP